MKIDTVITLNDEEKYYLTDETIKDNKKYFIGVRLDEKNNATLESKIFEELIEETKTYLNEVDDPELLNNLADAFTAQTNYLVDEMEEV